MRRFMNIDLPPEPLINDSCVRKRLKNSICDNCATSCPVDAVSFTHMNAKIDNELCFQCGNCLFSCPVDAIENIAPHERTYQNDYLVISHDEPLANAEELVVWHRQYGIRGIQIAEPLVDKWLPTLAALNLKLKTLQEPIWQLLITQPLEVDSGRRMMLFRQKLDQKPLNKGSVKTGLNARKQFYPEDSWFQIELESSSCILCGACAKVCDEQAIEIENNQFSVDEKRCTGCMSCQVVCFPKSIHVHAHVAKNSEPVTYQYYDSSCHSCNLPFLSWEPDAKICPICAQHKKQGWL
ncbi:ferredoxin [Providencia heimbachae]|uniref:4Fe-4S binding protein n=1 Tax=Providencia heimbachae TaxID=333962 RepID=UPI0010BF4AE1|nr:4Fe-4S binding protein [Providencia heimbachae]QCJ70153.1 ferredoxin [Providencia heimbachae]